MNKPIRQRLAIMAGSALLIGGCGKEVVTQVEEVVHPVKLFEVADAGSAQIRHFPATVTASDEAEISFRIAGVITQLPLSESQLVKKGQLLAKLDDVDVRNTLADRQASYELAAVDYKRKKDLVAKKAVAQSVVDEASAQLKSARAALELARSNLAYTKLTAPFDGRVAKIETEQYQYVQARQGILLLQSNNTVDIHIQVPEGLLASIKQSDVDFTYKPAVTFNSLPDRSFKVIYKERASKITIGTQSYDVAFTMPIPEDATILPGMAATLTLDLAKVTPNVEMVEYVLVPRQSVAKNDASGQTVVWKYDEKNSSVSSVEVSMGRITDQGIQIFSGLKSGDRIVAAGASQISEGMKVKPLRWERGL